MSLVTRREFFSYSMIGGALMFGTSTGFANDQGDNGAKGDTQEPQFSPLVKIHKDNKLTFYYPSPEMGQGVDTSLAQLFVDELGGDMALVSVKPMPYLIKLDDKGEIAPVVVPQFAGGSTSISRNYSLLRQAGARARQLLLQAASKNLKLPVEQLDARQSFIITESASASKVKVAFGDLIEQASKEQLADDFEPRLKERTAWQAIGKTHHSKQALDIVTGKPLYGMDMDYPNVKVAMMARSPYLDGYVESVDSKAVEKLSGVHAVVTLPRPELDQNYTYLAGGVAVIADDFWTAKKARDLLNIKWNKGPHSDESTQSLDAQCQQLLSGKGQMVRDDGDFNIALKAADKVITHTYRLPLVSHAQLEPQNCIAHVTDKKCTIIGPMQSPGGASRHASQITGYDRVDIDIKYTRLGGGFGRRLSSDHVAEAVTISKMSGHPVKLIWTREDDLAHDFYRPMGHHQMTAAVDKSGKIIAWAHRLAGTPKHYRRGRKPKEIYDADMYLDDFPAGLVENLQNEYFVAKSGMPQGSWRAPAHTANAFVVQSFLDEVALELGKDPLALRLEMLGEPQELEYGQHGGPTYDTGRMAHVLQRAAALADWGRAMPPKHALGIAGHFTFGGYCAHVAEVEILNSGQYKVHKVYAAIDVGLPINPDGIIAQVEGGINDGLSTARGQQVLVEGGRVITENFDSYHMMRIGDSVTDIEVEVIASNADPSGAGEMGLPPIAPAVANALKAAGGKRVRQQPIKRA